MKTPAMPAGEKKAKVEKEKKVDVPFVNKTPKGEKKSKCWLSSLHLIC